MKKFGFTLIELIVVITILSILGTIGFISLKGYTGDARDAKVISDTTNLQKSLSLYDAQKGTLPMPDNAIKIKSGSDVITYEGEIGSNVKNLINASDSMKTPYGDNYLYATNGDKKYFSVIGLLENNTVNLITTAHAKGEYKLFKGDEILTVFNSDNTFVDSEFIIDSGDFSVNLVFLGEEQINTKDNVPATIKTNKRYTGNWTDFDPNCKNPDIKIGNQVWAGCNSTLGDGIERGKQNDGTNGTLDTTYGCQDYHGNNDNSKCHPDNPKMLSNANPKDFFNSVSSSSDKEYDTIWGKLYTWSNSGSACPAGWHVPRDDEFKTLETSFSCPSGDLNRVTLSGCDGLGWKDHNIKTSNNNIANVLQLPLVGYHDHVNSRFYRRGFSTILWSNTSDGNSAYGRSLNYSNPGITRQSRSTLHSF